MRSGAGRPSAARCELISGRSASQIREHIRRLLEDIKAKVNEGVASFSRLSRVIEQTEPFEKTPTQKIKRYLYVERTIDGEGAISV